MLKDRRQSISDIIDQKGEVSLHELEALFPDVSSMTIRRDLDFLEIENRIIKIKGGAKSLSHLSRSVIAEKAAPLAETGRSIFIDAGSTMMQLARQLKNGRFSIITNGVNVALELSQNQSATVNLVGGELNRSNLCVSGAGAIEHVRHINIDIAFMAASGYSLEDGFTNGSFDEQELKRFVIQKAKKTIILMDAGKLGKSMPHTFCMPEDVDILIMDEAPNVALKQAAAAAGMQIM